MAPVASSVSLAWPAITGAVVSCTAMVKLDVLVLPAASVAVSVIVWVPSANVSPDWTAVVPSLNETVSVPSTTSDADAEKVATAPVAPVASSVSLAWPAITGAVVSCTAMVKLDVLVLPAASVAVSVIVWVPSANVSPDWTAVVPSLNKTVSVPSTTSDADAEKVATAPVAPVASSVSLAWQMRRAGREGPAGRVIGSRPVTACSGGRRHR